MLTPMGVLAYNYIYPSTQYCSLWLYGTNKTWVCFCMNHAIHCGYSIAYRVAGLPRRRRGAAGLLVTGKGRLNTAIVKVDIRRSELQSFFTPWAGTQIR